MKKLTTSILTLSLGLTLTSSSFAEKMYFFNSQLAYIERANLDGTNIEDLVTTGISNASTICIDETNSKMYWLDTNGKTISKSNLDGTSIEVLVNSPGFIATLALDLSASKMYWKETSVGFKKSDLDGSNIETIISGNIVSGDVEIDTTNSKMYWTDIVNDNIQRADLDGSNIEVLVTGLDVPQGIALDVPNSKMYWVDRGTDKVQRADLDGSNVEDLVTTGLNFPYEIDIDFTNSKLYWTDRENSKIQKSNLDGTNVEDVIAGGIDFKPSSLDFGPGDDSPLSVELNSFSARQIENSIQLNWSTASETENEGFNIFRKTDKNDFVKIASYKSHSELVGQGNSTFETSYSFVDNSKLQNNEFYTYVISDVETNGVETTHENQAQTVRFTLSEEVSQTKLDYVLAQNFPNPFNPSTTIAYELAKDTKVSLKIYNEKGDFVKELTNGFQNEGSHSAVWNGTDSNGKSVSSGTYFYKLTAGTFTQTNKMILLK